LKGSLHALAAQIFRFAQDDKEDIVTAIDFYDKAKGGK
jgi:hypothetical protein